MNFIVIPTALVTRLLILFNLNAIVSHCPSVPLPHEYWTLASFDGDSTPELDL